MLKCFQMFKLVIEVRSKKEVSNKNTCKKPAEPHKSFDIDLTTTTQTMEERKGLLKMDLENFPMSIIEIMLFKLEDNGEIAAQNSSKYCWIHMLSKQTR